jgi:hypothetical protein
VDNFTGSTGNDTFNAFVTDAATGTTFDATDKVAGGAGTDTLNITVGGASTATTNGADISGIETINIRNTGTGAAAINASNTPGATTVAADRGTGTLQITNLAAGAAVSVVGNGTVANGETAFAYATATSAVTLNLADGLNMTARITARDTLAANSNQTATTATINSTGAANTVGTVDLANATLTTATINAATNLKGDLFSQATDQFAASGSLTISGTATTVELIATLDDSLVTIDASGLTAGGVKATLGSGATSYKGGAGVDTITVAATTTAVSGNAGNDVITVGTNILSTGSVDGGSGIDTVAIAAGNALTSTTAAKITNVEVLRVSSTGTQTYDYSLISGLTNLEVGTGTSIIVNKLGASTPVKVIGTQATDLALNLASVTGTSDAITVTLENQNAAMSIAALSITGVETLSLVSSATSGTNANTVTTLLGTNNSDLKIVNISGAQEISLTTGALAQSLSINASSFTGKSTISAAALTGVATITGGSGADTITGSAQADTINAGGGADVITVAASADTLNGEAGNDIFTSGALTAVAGTTINGGDGTDTIRVTTGDTANYSATGVTISNIEAVTLQSTGGATGATFSGAQITGQSWTISGDAAANVDTLTVTATAGGTVTLASLQFNANWLTTDLVVLNGSTAQEILIGSSANDRLSGLAGIDTLTGGGGSDQFRIDSALAANRDIITDFKAGATAGDVFNLNSGVATLTGTDNFAAAASIQAVTTAGNTTVLAATEVVSVRTATIADITSANSLDGTNLLTALGGTLTGAIGGQNDILLAVGITGGGTAIYYATSANNAIIASEISLVGVLQGVAVADLVFGNFANAA